MHNNLEDVYFNKYVLTIFPTVAPCIRFIICFIMLFCLKIKPSVLEN